MELRTIMTFTNPADMLVIRSLLESEGIMCYTKDEMTIQVNPFYSNAIGGVKLQVSESDTDHAIELLREAGYYKEEVLPPTPNWLVKLDDTTAKLPLLNRMRLTYRLVIIIGVLLTVAACIVYYASVPTLSAQFIQNKWCLNTVVYQQRAFQPLTIQGKYPASFFGCDTEAVFNKDGSLLLPGFSTPNINAHWAIKNNQLTISAADTFSFVYAGVYEIHISDDNMQLTSDSTKIFLSRYGHK